MNEAEKEKKEKEELLKRFGEHIVKIRLKKKMSGAELARRCFMDKPNITRLEKGRINPSLFYLKKICAGLEINLKELFRNFKDEKSS